MSEMKLIMERWDGYLNEAEAMTAEDYVKRIKTGLLVLAARGGGKKALAALRDELGPAALEAGLEMVKAIPAVGNVVSSLSALFKGGKVALGAIMAGKEIAQATAEVLKIGSGTFIEMPDDEIGDNPLATLFNIDAQMQAPIKDETLRNFAGYILNVLQQEPTRPIPDPDNFAEQALAAYMKEKGYFKEVEPPEGAEQ